MGNRLRQATAAVQMEGALSEWRVIRPQWAFLRYADKSAMWITKAFSVAVDLFGKGTKATEGCLFARFRKK
jgi:hypothetical protein